MINFLPTRQGSCLVLETRSLYQGNIPKGTCKGLLASAIQSMYDPAALQDKIDLFAIVCLVTWPLNESEAGGDLVMIETSLLLLCKFLLIRMRTASLT